MDLIHHYKTVTAHRKLVRKYCFRFGLYRQGLCHDLSKFSPVEFLVGVKYYQGDSSPNNAERKDIGYSSSWLHHKGRNRHHFEYWIDYSNDKDKLIEGVEMPVLYVIEMFADRIAACRTYQKDAYTDESPWKYHARSNTIYKIMHPNTIQLLERLLKLLAREGEDVAFAYVQYLVKQERKKIWKERFKKWMR
ncbi:MAG: DUF5662 family protein [Bacillota bacterium]